MITRWKVEKPAAGEARITCESVSGRTIVSHELDAAKADAMTGALAAVGQLGVWIKPGE